MTLNYLEIKISTIQNKDKGERIRNTITVQIANNIRNIRKEKKFTLLELSRRSHVSASMLSKIENHQIIPSIATYIKISSALEINFGELIPSNDIRDDISIIRSEEMPVITRDTYIVKSIAFKKGKKKIEPFLFYYPPSNKIPKHSHNNEEMIYVLEGKIEFNYGTRKIVLKKGDCAYYNGIVLHGARGLSLGESKAIVVEAMN